jgi:carboxymethylenebutenolidase
MTEIQRYLAEGIAEDHADGLVSRREALRRLGLLGLSGAAAASLLAGAVVEQAKALAGTKVFLMGRVGIEPTTLGLKVPCSAS